MALTFPLTVDTRVGPTQDRLGAFGDSFIEGYGTSTGVGGGMLSPMFARIQAAQAAAHGTLTTKPTKIVLPPSYRIPCFQNGVSGTGINDLNVNYATRVKPYAVTLGFILVSQNDWTNIAGWAAAATSLADKNDADNPLARWCFISNLFGQSEQWTAGGWDSAVGQNASVASLNNVVTTWIAGRDQNRYIFANLRGNATSDANTVLARESVINAPAPGVTSGLLIDGTFHPAKAITPVAPYCGQREISDMLYTRLSVLT